MTKKFILLTFLISFFGCSNFEFVYDKSPILEAMESQTSYSINGDDPTTIKSYLRSKIGYSDEKAIYIIEINSTKNETLQVIEKDATASKINISHSIDYNLALKKNACTILSKNFFTQSTYDSKSAGYNFGTDISKSDIARQNIINNIEKFLAFVSTNIDTLECKNEN